MPLNHEKIIFMTGISQKLSHDTLLGSTDAHFVQKRGLYALYSVETRVVLNRMMNFAAEKFSFETYYYS